MLLYGSIKTLLTLGAFPFQSTPSVWRETNPDGTVTKVNIFQSTPSVWRETLTTENLNDGATFQSTPSVWRETTSVPSGSTVISISIHSLRVEGDGKGVHLDHNAVSDFNPLPPCGGRPKDQISLRLTRYFNPLPPCGGRPLTVILPSALSLDFNPLPPCGGRHG